MGTLLKQSATTISPDTFTDVSSDINEENPLRVLIAVQVLED